MSENITYFLTFMQAFFEGKVRFYLIKFLLKINELQKAASPLPPSGGFTSFHRVAS